MSLNSVDGRSRYIFEVRVMNRLAEAERGLAESTGGRLKGAQTERSFLVAIGDFICILFIWIVGLRYRHHRWLG